MDIQYFRSASIVHFLLFHNTTWSRFNTTRLKKESCRIPVDESASEWKLTFDGALSSCFFPPCARALAIAGRLERRELMAFFLLVRLAVDDFFGFTVALAVTVAARLTLDEIKELFSLSLELRSMETVRLDVGVVFSEEWMRRRTSDRKRRSITY